MDEELKAKLLQYLELIEQGATEHGRETVSQWISWAMWSHGIWAVLSFALSSAFGFGLVSVASADTSKMSSQEKDNLAPIFGICIACTLLPLLPFIYHLHSFLKVWLAPNVFIIQELATLAKG